MLHAVPQKDHLRHSSMSFLVPRLSFPAEKSDGGLALFSYWKNLSRLPSYVWLQLIYIYNCEKSSTSHFIEFSCCFPFDTLSTRVLNSGNTCMFRWIVLCIDLVLSIRHSFLKDDPENTPDTLDCNRIFEIFGINNKQILAFLFKFPNSSMTVTKEWTSLANDVCTVAV